MTRIRYASDLHVDINKKLGISWEEMINKLCAWDLEEGGNLKCQDQLKKDLS